VVVLAGEGATIEKVVKMEGCAEFVGRAETVGRVDGKSEERVGGGVDMTDSAPKIS
jgi:hypothetical protein